MTSLEMRATELITNLKIIIFNLLCKCSGPYFSNKSQHPSLKTTIHSITYTPHYLKRNPPTLPLAVSPENKKKEQHSTLKVYIRHLQYILLTSTKTTNPYQNFNRLPFSYYTNFVFLHRSVFTRDNSPKAFIIKRINGFYIKPLKPYPLTITTHHHHSPAPHHFTQRNE